MNCWETHEPWNMNEWWEAVFPIYIHKSMHKNTHHSTFLQLIDSHSFLFRHSGNCTVAYHWGLSSYFPDYKEAEHVSLHRSSLCEVPVIVSCPFFFWTVRMLRVFYILLPFVGFVDTKQTFCSNLWFAFSLF